MEPSPRSPAHWMSRMRFTICLPSSASLRASAQAPRSQRIGGPSPSPRPGPLRGARGLSESPRSTSLFPVPCASFPSTEIQYSRNPVRTQEQEPLSLRPVDGESIPENPLKGCPGVPEPAFARPAQKGLSVVQPPAEGLDRLAQEGRGRREGKSFIRRLLVAQRLTQKTPESLLEGCQLAQNLRPAGGEAGGARGASAPSSSG